MDSQWLDGHSLLQVTGDCKKEISQRDLWESRCGVGVGEKGGLTPNCGHRHRRGGRGWTMLAVRALLDLMDLMDLMHLVLQAAPVRV